jgi:sialic acid synthase SpsE
MIKLIAETAWHHEGDFAFMHNLVSSICSDSEADIVKMHISLDLDEYMSRDHEAYDVLIPWMLSAEQWKELINLVKESDKEVMLLLNDTKAIEFVAQFNPDYIELHSSCLNVPTLQNWVLKNINSKSKIIIGVGGNTIQEIDAAINTFSGRDLILMFGFQNFPTKYEDINLSKVRKIQALYPNKDYGYADHTAWNEDNNELITLLVTANGISYVEKHVTTAYGQERCDYSAAISIDMFNQLASKVKTLSQVNGDGLIKLNAGEKKYTIYGPMKLAAIASRDIKAGDVLDMTNVRFCRTSQITKMSQVDVVEMVGSVFNKNIDKNMIIDWECFE